MLPVIATDVGGNSDIIKQGVTGLLIPPANSGKIASAIERFITDSEHARELGPQLREHIVRHFRFDDMISRTLALY